MIVRREAFNAVEGFDPSFFLHSEETDLCLRVRQAGFEIGYIPEVEVRHVGGASDALSDCYAAWIRRMTGLHRFWTKHYSHADVIRLARRDLRRSWLRSTIYGAILRFCPQSVRVYEKQRRNDAIRDASRHLLARCRAGDS
jgi:GT2 family glycosyltransferase